MFYVLTYIYIKLFFIDKIKKIYKLKTTKKIE